MINISIDRLMKKLDEYLGKNDYLSAEKHLIYWLNEAKAENDKRTELTITNELIGLYRKISNENKAIECVETAIELVSKLEMEKEVSGATTYINCATTYKAFGRVEKSIDLFKKARDVYEKELKCDDSRLAGLYNNMALTLVDLKNFDSAIKLYRKAISILEENKNGELEIAITYLNIASCLEEKIGIEQAEQKINECVNIAQSLIDSFENRNGYYAFVCEKCAGVFGYYGYFAYENELKKRARRIYEGA
ncbi:MAG: tetratricopeptide repeat protein [Clostridia bacterium]|nr:tetratricopeptide repeat protein [Clostridia bacterium]